MDIAFLKYRFVGMDSPKREGGKSSSSSNRSNTKSGWTATNVSNSGKVVVFQLPASLELIGTGGGEGVRSFQKKSILKQGSLLNNYFVGISHFHA